jgi:hypothetical protein
MCRIAAWAGAQRRHRGGQQAIVVGNSPEAFKAEIVRELARFKGAATAAKIELN